MSKPNSPWDLGKMWFDYNRACKAWMDAFETLQVATNDLQSKYNEIMAKAIKDSSDKILNQFTENWQKSMSNEGIKTFKQFGDNWQKVFGQSAMEQVKTYGEAMNEFAEIWRKMLNE